MKKNNSICLIALIIIFSSCKKKFNSEDWINNPSERYKMSEDLINSGLLKGKKKADIIRLLSKDTKEFDSISNEWMYYTKIGKGYPDAKIEILDLEFKNDTVHSVSIRN